MPALGPASGLYRRPVAADRKGSGAPPGETSPPGRGGPFSGRAGRMALRRHPGRGVGTERGRWGPARAAKLSRRPSQPPPGPGPDRPGSPRRGRAPPPGGWWRSSRQAPRIIDTYGAKARTLSSGNPISMIWTVANPAFGAGGTTSSSPGIPDSHLFCLDDRMETRTLNRGVEIEVPAESPLPLRPP